MLAKENTCTGCSACEQVCPVQAVVLHPDEQGIMIPVIQERCINCGLCEKVCPVLHPNNVFFPQAVYAAASNNNAIIKKSSSGGVFTVLAQNVIRAGGIACGCAMESTKAKHIIVDKEEDLVKLQGSKYVQSDLRGVFPKLKERLDQEINVIFSGTPCQVDALKNFLQRDYNNLLTIDIICHGCPPQQFLDAYVAWLEKKYHAKVEKINFRDKSKNGWGLMGEIKLENNKKVVFYPARSSYYYYFDKGAIYRPACYQCKYASIARIGDITLGDYWGIERNRTIAGSINISNGVSLVLINSEHGSMALKQIEAKLSLLKGSLQEAKIENIQLSRPVAQSKYRADLLAYAVYGDYGKVEAEYRKDIGKLPLRAFIGAHFPAKIKYWLKRWK